MQQQTPPETRRREMEIIRTLLSLPAHTEIEFSDFGWTSRVYIVDGGKVVFKFPRDEAVKAEYRRETVALKLAREIADDVLVPEVEWQHPESDYLGYRGIVGRPLDRIVATLDAAEKTRIGRRLGHFLHEFHRLDMAEAPIWTLQAEYEEYAYKLELGLPCLREHFNDAEVTRLEQLVLAQYRDTMNRLGTDQGLCHGDLGYWNVIHGPNGETGLIDFGDVGYRDTSIDFAGMSDPHILNAALQAYEGTVSREKIGMHMKLLPVIDLPFFLGKEDEAGIAATIRRIRETALV